MAAGAAEEEPADPKINVADRDVEAAAAADAVKLSTSVTVTSPTLCAPPQPQPPQGDPPPLGAYDYPPRPASALRGLMSANCPAPCWYRRRIGRFYVLHETKAGEPVCLVGPCWPMLLVTFSLIAGLGLLVIVGLGRGYVPILVIGGVLLLVTLVGFVLTAFRDPGIVPRRQVQLGNDELYDERALSFRPYGAIYEYETGTMIRDIDHFCPWIGGGVVTARNMMTFRVFTCGVCVLIPFAVVVVILWSLRVIHVV